MVADVYYQMFMWFYICDTRCMCGFIDGTPDDCVELWFYRCDSKCMCGFTYVITDVCVVLHMWY